MFHLKKERGKNSLYAFQSFPFKLLTQSSSQCHKNAQTTSLVYITIKQIYEIAKFQDQK